MVFFEGIAGFAYSLNDIVAILAFLLSIWIAIMALINLGYYKFVDASWRAYSVFVLSALIGIVGQVALYTTRLLPSKMGILGQPPEFTNLTLVCAIAMFVISRFIRSQRKIY
jgi:hypothetical protein